MAAELSKDVLPDDKSLIGSKSKLSDDELWVLIEADKNIRNRERVTRNKAKFLKKIRRYFESIEKSEGFDCFDFPGRISGVTTVEPRVDIIRMMNYRPECYHYLSFLASEAIKLYNQQNDTRFTFFRLNNVNRLMANDSHTFYYITFAAANLEDYDEFTFQTKVCDKISQWRIEFCKLKVYFSFYLFVICVGIHNET